MEMRVLGWVKFTISSNSVTERQRGDPAPVHAAPFIMGPGGPCLFRTQPQCLFPSAQQLLIGAS